MAKKKRERNDNEPVLDQNKHYTTVEELAEELKHLHLQPGAIIRYCDGSDTYNTLSIYGSDDGKTLWIDIEKDGES